MSTSNKRDLELIKKLMASDKKTNMTMPEYLRYKAAELEKPVIPDVIRLVGKAIGVDNRNVLITVSAPSTTLGVTAQCIEVRSTDDVIVFSLSDVLLLANTLFATLTSTLIEFYRSAEGAVVYLTFKECQRPFSAGVYKFDNKGEPV